MSRWIQLAHDPLARTTQYMKAKDGDVELYTVQDIEPIIEDAKAQFNQTPKKPRWRDGMNKVASVPLSVIYEYRKRGIDLLRDQKAIEKFFNDSDNSVFRVRQGQI